MSGTQSEAQWPMFRRAARTVVVVDLVESVRLIEQNEEDTVRRWQAFVGEVVTRLLPPHGGRLVKSLGDGLMVEFEAVPPAIQCAIAMQTAISHSNHGRPNDQWMCLRIGAHVADVIVDERDIYGAGVNLAARLTTLAGPGEIVVSADVRDQLVPGLDADVQDMGECFFKHVSQPVRAYRLHRTLQGRMAMQDQKVLRMGVAVLPLVSRVHGDDHDVLGDLLADEFISGLSRTESLHVISRLSTSALSGRTLSSEDVGKLLHVEYVVSGSFNLVGDSVRAHVELARADTGGVVWSEGITGKLADVLMGTDTIVAQVVAQVGRAINRCELERASTAPLPTLESHSLLLASIGLIHRASRDDFDRAHDILEHLAVRHARMPQAHAWLGKWHAMRLVQGLSGNPALEARTALDKTHRALDADPSSSLALTMAGLVHGFMLKDLDEAERHYLAAIAANPNEALAWLYMGTLRAWQGRAEEAVEAAERALRLSPLDPMQYYFDSLAGFAAMTAGRHERAAELSLRSLRANRLHSATYRTLAISQWKLGQYDDARATVAELMRIEPSFTTSGYLDRFPGGRTAASADNAETLRSAGAPA